MAVQQHEQAVAVNTRQAAIQLHEFPSFEHVPKDSGEQGANYFFSADFEGDSVFGLVSFFPESLLESVLASESDFDSDFEVPAAFFA
jgi:hypothetical protein